MIPKAAAAIRRRRFQDRVASIRRRRVSLAWKKKDPADRAEVLAAAAVVTLRRLGPGRQTVILSILADLDAWAFGRPAAGLFTETPPSSPAKPVSETVLLPPTGAARQVAQAALEALGPQRYASWISPCQFREADGRIHLVAPTAFVADVLKSQYAAPLLEAARAVTGQETLTILVDGPEAAAPPRPEPVAATQDPKETP